MIKISDYIFDYFLSKGIDTIFCVAGGAAAHLLNSVHERKDKLKVTHCYHEQACAMAADGYYRISGKPAIVLVTNGPGSTNAITGVLGAYQDSIPMIVISGQVPKNQTIYEDSGLRQLGVQECDIISIVKSITKFAKQLRYENDICYFTSKAYTLATTGRMGPVWLDIPLDVQSTMFVPNNFLYTDETKYIGYDIQEIVDLIHKAKNPLIIAGNGIHLSKTEEKFREFLSLFEYKIPVVTTWNAKDLFSSYYQPFVGTFGLLGDRAGNFAVQNADLLIILGSRLSIPCIGYDSSKFSPKSTKIMVDVDLNELCKKTLNINVKINDDLESFFIKINKRLGEYVTTCGIKDPTEWEKRVYDWKWKYPTYQDSYKDSKDGINSYHFIEELGKNLKDNHVVVTDMGTAFTCTMQALKMNGKARLFTSSGTSSMGYGLPAAIGAWVADPTKEIILIAGDGGFQMNIQELQTIKHYNIPIKIFILNNNGYLAISLMQDNLFKGVHVGSTSESGVSAPDFVEVAKAYGIQGINIDNVKDLSDVLIYYKIPKIPILYEVRLPQDQLMLPRVQSSKDKDGKIISNSLENMFPYLPEEEMKEIMK